MLNKKREKLILREKLLLISGILIILSIPLLLINSYYMVISLTLFVVSVFYNLYKFMQMCDTSILEDIEINTKELNEGKKMSGIVTTIIVLSLVICLGVPMVFVLLIYIWLMC